MNAVAKEAGGIGNIQELSRSGVGRMSAAMKRNGVPLRTTFSSFESSVSGGSSPGTMAGVFNVQTTGGLQVGRFAASRQRGTMVIRDRNNIPSLLAAMPAITKEAAGDAAERMKKAAEMVWRMQANVNGRGEVPQGRRSLVARTDYSGRHPWPISQDTVRQRSLNQDNTALRDTRTLLNALDSDVTQTGNGAQALIGFENKRHPDADMSVAKLAQILENGWQQGDVPIPGFGWFDVTAEFADDEIAPDIASELLQNVMAFNTIPRR
jgi:hypothetical protein